MSSHKNKQEAQSQIIKWFGAIFLVMIGIFIGGIFSGNDGMSPVSKTDVLAPIYGKTTLEIAKEFECACGKCNEPDLVACTCPTAIQEKSAIQDLLNKGYERDKVIDTIEAMFGGRKT